MNKDINNLFTSFLFIYIYTINSTSTMIDILTTRFHDAYSYLVSEDVSRQNDNNNDIMKEKTSINRFNNEHIKYTKSETTLKDAEQVSSVNN